MCWINIYSYTPRIDSQMTFGVEINISGGKNTWNIYKGSMH